MLINFIKFIHMLCVLGLCGLVTYCFAAVSSKKLASTHFHQQLSFNRLNKIMLMLGMIAMLTGTFLVYPKNFTFHTPWIQAAYIFVAGFVGAMAILFWLQKKTKTSWLIRLIYFLLIVLFIFVIHDAVTKTTFILGTNR